MSQNRSLLFQTALASRRPLVMPLLEMVCFRNADPDKVFELIERRLVRRDSSRFQGYATARSSVHSTATPIEECVKQTAALDPRWSDHAWLLYSVELEVWMDLSRANSEVMALYEDSLRQGLPFHVRYEGPFNEIFCELLLQKNGFEQVVSTSIPDSAIDLASVNANTP